MRKGYRVVAAILAGFIVARFGAELMAVAAAYAVGLAAGLVLWFVTAPRAAR